MIRFIILITLLASFGLPSLGGNEAMIGEVEALLKSLPAEDPGRRELTLRLADLYFFVAIDLNKRASLSMSPTSSELHSDKLNNKAEQFRQRSLNLYRKSLKKFKLNGETRVKVKFQQARLLDQLGRKREALIFWEKSYRQKQVLNIRREAILKLAEDAQKASDLNKAERLYKEALTLCEEVCEFIHYRLGWVYRNQGKIIPALKEIEQALWDNKGQSQEEVLRDYIAFLAQRGGEGDGPRAIGIVENLMERTGQKDLLEQLAFGFYSAGNKRAGTKTLALITQRNPALKNQIRLLEEYYGLRRWDEFRELRERIVSAKISTLKKAEAKKVEQIMRRLAVQLEAEQKQSPQTRSEFLAVSDLYLELFPKSEVAMKVIRSWLGAEERPRAKMKKIAYWLGDKRRKFSAEDEIMLREERVRLAQEQKDYAVIRSEMEQLVRIYSTIEKKEKAKYLIAYSYYQENKLDMALSLFLQLAKTATAHGATHLKRPMPSKWAIQSQHLTLDIFNQRKDYQQLMAQADSWLKQKWESPLIHKELTDIRRVREQANFENAVMAGETPAALETFFHYCQVGKFAPKSCQNAKRLSVILKDQLKLLAVLEKINDKKSLVNEYEVSGRYIKAAALLAEKNSSSQKTMVFSRGNKDCLTLRIGEQLGQTGSLVKITCRALSKKTDTCPARRIVL